MQKVEGKLTFCQAVLQSALRLQHFKLGLWWKASSISESPNSRQSLSSLQDFKCQLGQGSSLSVQGSCLEVDIILVLQIFSLLAYKVTPYGCDVLQTGFSSFWQWWLTRFPSRNDLAQIHSTLDASNMPLFCTAFHRREAVLQHPYMCF